jgi:hypothetical protein
MADELVRPNGKPYRPRRVPSVEGYVDWHDDVECVVVVRTHDIPLALQLAADRIAELELNPENAHTDWWRLVPWGSDCYDNSWIPDPVRGVPCVVIPYE